jgi:hypothetical protein
MNTWRIRRQQAGSCGQLRPVAYLPELTADGFIDPDVSAKSFMGPTESFSPVIQFRWGYKASAEELQQYGNAIYLNEDNYWGGGTFANGCTALPDLWGAGLADELFLWLHVQHLNPTNDRRVYACPPRPALTTSWRRCAWRSWSKRSAPGRPTRRSPSSATARAI